MKFEEAISHFEQSFEESREHVLGGLQAGMIRMLKDHDMHDLNAAEEQLMICRATIIKKHNQKGSSSEKRSKSPQSKQAGLDATLLDAR